MPLPFWNAATLVGVDCPLFFMKNAVFYLIGPPGVGKYTVGTIIAEGTAARLVDNHYSINPIFGLI